MYCCHCGKEISEDSAFCPYCGAKLNEAVKPSASNEKDEFFDEPVPQTHSAPRPTVANKNTNTLAIVGFVLSFFVSIAGLVCSIIGLKQCNQTGERGKGLAIAGIVLSAVSMFVGFIMGIVMSSAILDGLFYYY